MKITIANASFAEAAKTRVCRLIDDALRQGRVVVDVRREKRTDAQNRIIHSRISDIHDQGVIEDENGVMHWLRDQHPSRTKAVLVNAFAIEMESSGTPLASPSGKTWDWINGGYTSVRPSTTQFTYDEAGQFVAFLEAIGADKGIDWTLEDS